MTATTPPSHPSGQDGTSAEQLSPPPRLDLDPWSVWFSRLTQASGLLLIAWEAVREHRDRPVLIGAGMAMLIGSTALQLIARGILDRLAGAGR